jgi:hypothetical protein
MKDGFGWTWAPQSSGAKVRDQAADSENIPRSGKNQIFKRDEGGVARAGGVSPAGVSSLVLAGPDQREVVKRMWDSPLGCSPKHGANRPNPSEYQALRTKLNAALPLAGSATDCLGACALPIAG